MKVNPVETSRKDFYHMLSAAFYPRPIAWVSSVSETGVFNLAPFSFFHVMSANPPLVCFSIASKRDGSVKDTLLNVEWSRDFVASTVNEPLAAAMNQTSAEYPRDVDEFKEVGMTPIKSDIVKAPRVAESPINIECRVKQITKFGESPEFVHHVIGEIVRMHIKDDFFIDGSVSGAKLKNVGRLWGKYYCRTTDQFEMLMPDPL